MPLKIPEGLVVSVSGFRGRVGDPLTPELVCALAAAFGASLRAAAGDGTLIIGRDSRTSGAMLSMAAASGLLSVGCDVVDLGIVATPTLMLEVERTGALGGIQVTASHNPAEWNALKLAAPEGTFLDADTMAAFLRFATEEDPKRAAWDDLGSLTTDHGAAERHLESVLELPLVDLEAIRSREFKVALDCVRGAGATIMPALLEALGCRVVAIHTDMDGHFPRDPEPTAENLQELGELVRQEGADLGLAVDPDVDRLSLVNERGEPVGEDLTLALAAAVVLSRTPGIVVTNLSTSQVVEDVARAHDSRVIRSSVGEINVARRMQSEGAVIGGEGNGGVILPSLHYTRDAPVGAALILQLLVDEGASLSEAVAQWPSYVIVKRKVDFPRDILADAYDVLEERLEGEEVDREDGLRLYWSSRRAWLHVRPSGTEPIVRLIAEALTRGEAEELIESAASVLTGLA
jgi:phosphomannomutase